MEPMRYIWRVGLDCVSCWCWLPVSAVLLHVKWVGCGWAVRVVAMVERSMLARALTSATLSPYSFVNCAMMHILL